MNLVLIIDLVLVGLVVLFAIIGLIKGFFKSFLDFFGTIVSLIISIVLARYLAAGINNLFSDGWLFGGGGSVARSIENGLVKLSGPIFGTAFSSGGSAEELTAMMTEGGIPSFLAPILAGVVSKFNFTGAGLTLAQILAPMITNVILIVIVTILLFIVLKIIVSLLNKFFKFLTKNKAVSGLNRLFGFIIGAFKGALVAALVLIVFSFLPNSWGFVANFNDSLESTALAKHFNTFVYETVGKNIDLDKIIGDLFPGAKKMTEKEQALYSKLNVDFTADGQKPSDFAVLGGDAENAVAHFRDFNNSLLGKIGQNGYSDAQMDSYIAKAADINDKYSALFGKLSEYNALAAEAEDTSAVEADINTLLNDIEELYSLHFDGFAGLEY